MALNPEVNFFDNLGIRYEKAFGHDVGLRNFVQGALDTLPQNAKVLDIGCGTGKPTSSMVATSGRQLHGIDFSPVMIDLSRKQVPEGTFETVNMLDYNPSIAFDAAFSIFSTFQLTRDEMYAMAVKWSEWIKPNGSIFIGTMVAEDFPTEPHMFDPDGLCARGIEHTFMGSSIGNHLYTRGGWDTLLRQAGFEIVHTETSWFQPPADAKSDIEPHYYITAHNRSHAVFAME